MLEMLIKPRKAERRPWEMFFVGLFYGSLSIILVNWMFSQDPILSKYSGLLVVTFTVMFSLPFVYYTIKLEEKKITPGRKEISLLKEHEKAIFAFMWLFLGFVFAFSIMYILFAPADSYRAQIETYCMINRPSSFDDCTSQYGLNESNSLVKSTGSLIGKDRFVSIFVNNIYVLIFTLIFSLIFGAGAIFVLAWNASVIAAAIKIFTNSSIASLPIGIARYMIHGIPEIAAYFITALAGGIVSVAVIRHEIGTEKFWEVLQDALTLIVISIAVLFLGALIEVYITPLLF